MHSSSLRTSTRSKFSPSRGSCFFALSAYDTSDSRRSSSGSDSNRLMILFNLAGYMGMKIYRGFPPCHSELSEAEPKDLVKPPYGIATGSLDFARDDRI